MLARVGAVVSVLVFTAVAVTGCSSRMFSCDTWDDLYQDQLEKYAFYAALVDGLKAGNATTNNREYDSAVKSRDSLWDSAEKIRMDAADEGCSVRVPQFG